jgi:peptide/nickel transport system permease protein
MKQGRIVETADVESILTAPQQPYTRTLLDSMLEEGPVRTYVPVGTANGRSGR